MDLKKHYLTAHASLPLALTIMLGCQQIEQKSLENRLNCHTKERARALNQEAIELHHEIAKLHGEISALRKENIEYKLKSIREKDFFKPGIIVPRFKDPFTQEEIFIEIDALDYLTARSEKLPKQIIPIETENHYLKILMEKLELPTNSPEKDAQKILYFVQSVPYVNDKYPFVKPTTVILTENSGNCFDHSSLAASMLLSIGIETMLVAFTEPEDLQTTREFQQHIGVAVSGNFDGTYFTYKGKKYFYGETTNDLKPQKFWEIGSYPKNMGKPKLIEIKSLNR